MPGGRTQVRVVTGCCRLFGLAVAVVVVLSGPVRAEPSTHAPLDVLWEQYMLEGRLSKITIALRDSRVDLAESASSASFEFARGHPESAAFNSYGISVMRLGEGIWGNAGWVVTGGLLSRTTQDARIVELYGKAVVRRFAYFPFPFHREIPHETGYDFFLLLRQPGTSGARVIRKWTFMPNEVLVKRETTAAPPEYVRGVLRYDAGSRVATVTISGLKHPFDERVDLSSALDAAPR
jgi:hypothetical protein